MTGGVLYGANPETLVLVTGALGDFLTPVEKPKTAVHTQKN